MTTGSSRRKLSLVVALLLLISFLGLGYLLIFQKNETISAEDWAGAWKITYFYENEPQLKYTGTLRLTFQDTLSSQLTLFAPKSKRPEQVGLAGISTTEEGIRLSGRIIHTQYKINEGFLTEDFYWQLETPDAFSGQGTCVAYCAEGTDDVSIFWKGEKSD